MENSWKQKESRGLQDKNVEGFVNLERLRNMRINVYKNLSQNILNIQYIFPGLALATNTNEVNVSSNN